MTPHILTLKNFYGIKAGTGMDEITIDIDAAAGDEACLVLLKGDNGSGKTTVLDNLTPYRLMPSRANGYSPGSFSYYDQTYGDAEKVFEWSHNGNRYRSQILIKGSGKAKKTEAYLQQRDGNGAWTMMVVHGGITSDGKTATYDACVERILGTPEMFFTAAFSSQGRRQLSSYSNADIKSLMAELLGLGDITDLGEKSATVMKLITARVNGIRQELSLYQGKRDTRDTIERDLQAATGEQAENEEALEPAKDALKVAADHLQETQRLSEQAVKAQKKRDELQELHVQIGNAMASRVHEINQDVSTEQQRNTSAISRHNATLLDISNRIQTTNDKIESSNKLLQRREEIQQAGTRVQELETEIVEAEQAGTSARVRAEKLKEIGQQCIEAHTEHDRASNELTTIDLTLAGLEKRAELTNDVPCAGTDLQSQCMLLQDANSASQAIPEQTDALKKAKTGLVEIEQKRQNIITELLPYKNADKEVQQAIDRYRKLQTELGNVKAIAALRESLDAAISEREQSEQERNRLTTGLEETEREHNKLLVDIDARIVELRLRIDVVERGAAQEQAALEEQIQRNPAGDTQALEQAEREHQAAQQIFSDLTDTTITLKAKVAAHSERIAVIDQELAGADALNTESERLNAEISHWQLLTKALGRDGIVALCIDDAGPTLATLTNDLLLSCYGPRFTVSIETQVQTAKGDTRETFDIRVFDGDRNEDKSVSDMSGGERIYINEAMTRAIALYQAQQSGQQYGTLFSDESDGALDPKRKIMFTNMKRKVLELGGYEREIFITHTPELWDLADAVIDLDAMKVA